MAQTAPASSSVRSWAWLHWASDSTPVYVAFGMLKCWARPMAKYYWRDSSSAAAGHGKWVCLSYEEYMRRKGGQMPGLGSLQLHVTAGQFCWPERVPREGLPPLIAINREPLYFAPQFLKSETASVLFDNLDKRQRHLAWDDIVKLSEAVSFIAVSIVTDLAAGNSRMKFNYGELAKTHNDGVDARGTGGHIGILERECLRHRMQTGVVSTFKTEELFPKLHATAWSSRQSGFLAALEKAIYNIVASDMATGFYVGSKPDPAWEEHTDAILNATILRSEFTKQSCSGLGVSEQNRYETQRALAGCLRMHINGSWKLNRLSHWCWRPDCCKDGQGRWDSIVLPRASKQFSIN